MKAELSSLWAMAADIETLQLQLDAARIALHEAAAAVLSAGVGTPAEVSEATGMSEAELERLAGGGAGGAKA